MKKIKFALLILSFTTAFGAQAEYLKANVPEELSSQLMQGLINFIPQRIKSAQELNCRQPELRIDVHHETVLIWPSLCSKNTRSAFICRQSATTTQCYAVNYGETEGNPDGGGLRDSHHRLRDSITLDNTVSAVLFQILNVPLEGGAPGTNWGKKVYKNINCYVSPWGTNSGRIGGAVLFN